MKPETEAIRRARVDELARAWLEPPRQGLSNEKAQAEGNAVTDQEIYDAVAAWLESKGWTRDGDDPGIWIPPNHWLGAVDSIAKAFAVATREWGWDGPVSAPATPPEPL